MTDQDDLPSPELADGMHLQASPFIDGQAAVATIGGVNVCWNCHCPVIIHGSFEDVLMGTAYVRICKKQKCAEAVLEERRMSTDSTSLIL